ncbi:hypothetical protein L211DRAFT_838383 [Terfezia boudieri ATCC MYA-4762]|uniref:Uncharacterized protein n=1 Tax=Terfezia boudieri ATCC MYA-4762 TaxID=1051890 RepID=A0A3N4LTH8_9PEZI|nr:hypothetical protein L211DRAFT_838383 [Terfezia boudieri ATCC MYA-4762]
MLYFIAILLTILATLATAATSMARQTTVAHRIELDAKVQRSIDLQVLAEFKEERVLQYCTDQLKRLQVEKYCNDQWTSFLASRQIQEENAQAQAQLVSLVYRPRHQSPLLKKRKKVRWADGWVDSDAGSTTECDE